MADLDIKGNELVEGVKYLAVRHYGDCSEASISRVVESALEMSLLATELIQGGANETEEPIADWEFVDAQPSEQLAAEIRSQLFRRR